MDIQRIYQELTGINIQQQKVLWDERGKGYYGEYLVFQELYKFLPGSCKILMNLEIPADKGKTTEVDLLLIHESGLYVFEVKHYKGTIYGKDNDNFWTQYFRTVKNNSFQNPIHQNSYHINNLKKLFPDLPVFSFIIFTNEDCNLKTTNNNQDITVCKLKDIRPLLNNKFIKSSQNLSMSKIDDIFNNLSIYSKMQETVTIDGEAKPFSEWLSPYIAVLNDEKKKVIAEKTKQQLYFKECKEKLKKTRLLGIAFNALVAVFCIVVSVLTISGFEKGYLNNLKKNTEELELFKQNFLHVDQIDNPFIDELQSYISIDSVTIKPLTDDAISFTATLTTLTDTYRIQFQENAKYIAITTDGKVFEYDVFDSTLDFNSITSIMGQGTIKTSTLQEKQFYGINNPEDIEHIKVTNVSVLKNDIQQTVLKSNLQLAIYTKPQ